MTEEERKKKLSEMQQSFGSKFFPKEPWPEEMFDETKDEDATKSEKREEKKEDEKKD